MKSTFIRMISAGILLFLLNISCTLWATVMPRLVTATPPVMPSAAATLIPVPTTQNFIPICTTGGGDLTPTLPSQCTPPTGEERDRFCTKKVPFTLIAMPEGAIYELLTPGFRCTEGGVHQGMHLITCTGPELHSFELKICNPACVASGSLPSQIECPQGYIYDSNRQCCAGGLQFDQAGCIRKTSGTKDCV